LVRVTVAIPGRPYDVTIGSGLLERSTDHLPELPGAAGAYVVSDREIAERWFEPISAGLAARGLTPVLLTVPAGEEAKSLQSYEALLRQLAGREAHRTDVIVGLGGGAVGDLAGFVAATYMRGLRVVQVPTTLTAQVDAAIGGKTGINLPEGKNLVGAFHQPKAVLADLDALATLDDRAYRSGLAEVAKVALTLDGDLLGLLENDPGPVVSRDRAVMETVVARCVAAKANAVAVDERDAKERLVLNYGHTIGHALERLDAFAGRTHGEAVAIGMLAAARLAEIRRLAADLTSRTERLLASLGLTPDGPLPPIDDVLRAIRLDKKYRGGVRFVLLEGLGRPVVADDVPDREIRSALEQIGASG
jgi:3-dehydroquinate synthase